MLALHASLLALAFLICAVIQPAFSWDGRGCPAYTKLLPRHAEYRSHCDADAGPGGADPKWPCFSMWYGDLTNANATVTRGEPDDFFLLKDGFKQDFTTRDPTQGFSLSWNNEDVSLQYSDYNKDKGCYTVTLKHFPESKMRIWVSDEANTERNADTKHHDETSTTVCSKWMHIHVKTDG